ncbi:hypothetical protein ACSSNL_13455 [Thalassobius sp. S69A]|uniref:hypothetical protein n=1 Tax=unclassified Thalassovita TaxID=2619711 RepID=UPI003C7B228E
MRKLHERDRDQRDLRILTMLDHGVVQKDAAQAAGVSRGVITRLLADIRADLAIQPYPERERAQHG